MDQVVYRFPKWDREADVIVAGYGAAGAATAITARDEGSDVVVLEKLQADAIDENGKITEPDRQTLDCPLASVVIHRPAFRVVSPAADFQ